MTGVTDMNWLGVGGDESGIRITSAGLNWAGLNLACRLN
jgi:hypothetical protein